MSLLEKSKIQGAVEVLLADRAGLAAFAQEHLGWPVGRDIWQAIGAQVGRHASQFPRVAEAWKERAKPGVPRRALDAPHGTPYILRLPRLLSGRDKFRGKFVASRDLGLPESRECAHLEHLRNLNPDGRIRECWILDAESSEVIGGWCLDFAPAVVANRWLQRARVLVATQLEVKRGKRKEARGKMFATGLSAPRFMGLHEYLAKPALRKEPSGLTMRANLSAQHRFVGEFLDFVEAKDSRLVEELRRLHAEHPDEPLPTWVTHDYQVRAERLGSTRRG